MARHESASTFSKGLRLLACFESKQRVYTMAELTRLTGFDRATTRRLCLSLIETGYLSKTDQNLRLTPKILSVAGGYLEANDIGLSVQPLLDQFAGELGSEISLAVRDGGRAIYVAKSKNGAIRPSIGLTVGSTLPLLHTGVGRAILSICDAATIDGVFQTTPPRAYTAKTALDVDTIRARITQATEQGFALVEEEYELGAAGIAVPVGTLTGAEAVVGVTQSVNKLRSTEVHQLTLDILQQTAMSLRRLSIFEP
jgi:IclR family pca regulon transcriptional regulator